MDALIPILLTIGFFIFQAYLGYKKEQEKALKRNPSKPGAPVQPTVQRPRERPSAPPVRGRVKEAIEQPYVQTYVEPTYESSYKQEKYVPTEKPVDLLAEYRRLASDDEDEVTRKARRLRNEKRSAIKRLTTIDDEETSERVGGLVHFDLEQAIKIKAILDRPYQ